MIHALELENDMEDGRERKEGKSDGKRDSANRLESQQSYRTTVKGSLPMGKGMKEVSRKEVE